MKIFICTNQNQLIGAKVAKNTILKKSKFLDDDVEIVHEKDVQELDNFFEHPYLRDGKMKMFDRDDMQSFTLLRFHIPEMMSYQGVALVLDPDIFLVRDGLEILDNLDLESSAIFCRKGLKKDSWSSSAMLLNCNKLTHWRLGDYINKLHAGKIDYNDLINLRLESQKISELDSKWNEFDEINPETILLHTTEKLTQPWRTGLTLNSSIPPIFGFIPRIPIYALFGRDLTIGRNHPHSSVSNFFLSELSLCIESQIIDKSEIDEAINKKYIREDIYTALDLLQPKI